LRLKVAAQPGSLTGSKPFGGAPGLSSAHEYAREFTGRPDDAISLSRRTHNNMNVVRALLAWTC
jgi:hypothetical protein